MALIFHAIELFDQSWHETPPYSIKYHYARFLSHLAKNRTAEHAAETTRLALEIFGGIGFMQDYAVSRMHREALVTAIWEGTSNIQSLDMLEAKRKKGSHEPFLDEFIPKLERIEAEEAQKALQVVDQTINNLNTSNPADAQWYSKEALRKLADATQIALLFDLAEDNGAERYAKLAQLYARRFIFGEPYPSWALYDPKIWGPLANCKWVSIRSCGLGKDSAPG